LTRTKQPSIQDVARTVLAETPAVDIHTHLYDPALGPLLLWGIDELVTYHYLVAEMFRVKPDLPYQTYWKMSKQEQADLIWHELFVKRSPVSEACRGVVTVLNKLGLDPNVNSLSEARAYFAAQTVENYVQKVFDLANVSAVYMTNDPMNSQEAPAWTKGVERDPRFLAVLRLDSALMQWPEPAQRLKAMGYDTDTSLSGRTISELKHYLNNWCDRLDAKYMAVSLPPNFRYPDTFSSLTTLMTKAVVPVASERNIPVAMMVGVKRLVNPGLQLAGDSVGKCDINTFERIARDFSDVKFLVTMLSRENSHELCVAARKFNNITPFGCWWFLNNPTLIREITAMRLDTLGLSFIPQHSDARVLDQLIYKWSHSRKIIGEVLAERYQDMVTAGSRITENAVRRDVKLLFNPEF